MRITLSTAESVNGARRKLAWFVLQGNGLYFDAGGLLKGSHTSYHVDGNVFRTSPATEHRPRFQGTQVPLAQFRGWHQLGFVMLGKSMLARNPVLKSRDERSPNQVIAVPIEGLPSDTLNIVLELVHAESRWLEEAAEFRVPDGALQRRAEIGALEILITLLGHESNLLIRPTQDGFIVAHRNERFSTNRKGVKYVAEAYSQA